VLGQGQTRALRMVFGHKLVITGQALNSDDKPVPDATVGVASQVGGQAFADIGQFHSDANGAFAFPVPEGPNRTLRFSYSSPVSNGQQATTQADVVLQVRATA